VLRLVGLVLLGLALAACERHADASAGPSTANASEAPLASTAQKVTLKGDEGAKYLSETARQLIESWRPLPFTGELKPYDPADLLSSAFLELVPEVCRGNKVWDQALAFKQRMGETPTAVDTPQGPVLYERVYEKYSEEDRDIYVGVRLSDRACGAFDRRGSKVVVAGDGDVIAATVAAFAIRAVDAEADQRTLTSRVRFDAAEAVTALLSSYVSQPAEAAEAPKPVRPYHFELVCAGSDSLLDFPLEANYRVNTKDLTWWICFAEDDCTQPEKAKAVSYRLVVFEQTKDSATIWSADTGRLDSVDRRIGMRRRLACRLERSKWNRG